MLKRFSSQNKVLKKLNCRTHTTLLVLLTITACFFSNLIQAQKPIVFSSSIFTPQIYIENTWNTLPIIALNDENKLILSFDDMNTEAIRYTYRINHCDEHFNPTENLFESAYLQATSNELLLENYEPSRNTVTPYNHYQLTLPNDDVKMLLPGNYSITIEQEDDDGGKTEALKAFFMILDHKVKINAQISTKTDIDFNHKHQQISVGINHASLNLHNPIDELKCVVVKNRKWEDAVWLNKPTMQLINQMKWEHNLSLVFKAGNEYRKFENLSTETASMHIDAIQWNATTNQYDVFLQTDEIRKNYLYNEDHNGAFVIRNTDNYTDNTESEYTNVHFRLNMPQLFQGEVYVDGSWATSAQRDIYRMNYDHEEQCYKANIWLKQGYYEYQYLSPNNEVEGDFYETENEYLILVYAKHPSERYTKLVGMTQISSKGL